ncbi:unknown [Prevotella sp. CAG:924]|nr:unknown [Prevotella sp. CAG:924]
MITHAGIHGSGEPAKLLGILLFKKWAETVVNQITGHQDQVGMFRIDLVHPSLQVGTPVVVTQMHITDHHDPHRSAHLAVTVQRQGLPVLMMIMHVAVRKHSSQYNRKDDCRDAIGPYPGSGNEMDEHAYIEQYENDRQIEIDEYRRRADAIHPRSQIERKPVEKSHAGKEHEK